MNARLLQNHALIAAHRAAKAALEAGGTPALQKVRRKVMQEAAAEMLRRGIKQ